MMIAAAYLRFSDENSNPRSLDDQLVNVLARAAADRQFIPWEYVFADFAVTGTNARRGSYIVLKELLADEESRLTTIYIDDFSRGGRNQLEWLTLVKLVRRWGTRRVVGVTDGFDSSQAQSQLLVSLLASISQMTSEGIASRVKRGMNGAARRGTVTGRVPFGYRKVPRIDERGRPVIGQDGEPVNELAIDPAAAEIVRRIFRDRAAGNSMVTISRWMNEERVGGSNRWSCSKAMQILDRPLYLGVQIYNATYAVEVADDGRKEVRRRPRAEQVRRSVPHLRIISRSEYLAAHRVNRRRARLHSADTKKPRSRNDVFPTTLLSGALFCGYCRQEIKMARSANEGRTRQLACPSRIERTRGCQLTSGKSARLVEEKLVAYVVDTILTDARVPEIVEAVNRALAEEASRPGPDVAALRQSAAERTAMISRLVQLTEATESGDPVAEVKSRLAQLNRERRDIDVRIREAEAARARTATPLTEAGVRAMLGRLREVLNQDVAAAAPVLRKLLGRVEVRQKARENKKDRATWLLRFKPTLAQAALEVEVGSGCPDRTTWEFLCGANWITEPEVEVVVASGLPKYAEYREVVVQRINGGETGEAVARSLGISRGAVGDA
jgi:DNA invertase Pin-like site-specific DNA recombinase